MTVGESSLKNRTAWRLGYLVAALGIWTALVTVAIGAGLAAILLS